MKERNTRKRARTGTLESYPQPDGSILYRCRLRLGDHTKSPRIDVPAGLDEAGARKWMASQQALEDIDGELLKGKREGARLRAIAAKEPHGGETADTWHARFVLTRPFNKTREAHRWRKYASPVIGHLPMAKINADAVEDLRDSLDRHVDEGRIRPKTAINIWACVAIAFREASRKGRLRELRVRDDNPIRDVAPPKRGSSRKRSWVYPSEALALLSCEAVPLEWRELHAIACYTYLRPQELHELRWKDVDFEHGIISVSRAWDEDFLVVGPPKSEAGIRKLPIEPALAPLLKRMARGKRAEDKVVPLLGKAINRLAKAMRSHLALAGVTRAELTELSGTREPVDFRTWRETGITWQALQKTGLEAIKSYAGHEEVSTTLGYIKRVAGPEGYGAPFPPIPSALLEGEEGPSSASGPATGPAKSKSPSFPGFSVAERVGFETTSNPCIYGVSATCEPCNVHMGGENPNDSIAAGPGNGPDSGADQRAEARGQRALTHNPRAELIAELSRRVEALALVGDAKALQVLSDALQRLVEASAGGRATVVDLATERAAKRGERGGK